MAKKKNSAPNKCEEIKACQEILLEQPQVEQVEVESEQTACEECQIVPLVELTEQDCGDQKEEKKKKGKKTQSEQETETILKDLSELATLLGTTVQDLKDEFYLLQIKKIMAKMQKVIVRYDMTDVEMEKIFSSAGNYGLGGITVAPAYLSNCVKQNKKSAVNKLVINSIIDFPFGESSLKGKVSDIKESVKMGVGSVAVALPSMMLNKENLKELKKQCRKFCACSKKGAGIVLNASDINEENYLEAIKVLKKTKLSYIAFAFGDATIEEVRRKLEAIAKIGINKKLFVLANVDRVESVVELFKLNVDCILSPYADDIGGDLLKRFNLIG